MAIDAQTLLLILFLLLTCSLMKRRTSKKQNKNLPPSPPKLPFIGNLHQLGSLPHQSLWQLSKTYGPVMHLQLGKMLTVVISSPEAAKEVLKTYDLDSCSRPPLQGARRLTYNYQDVAFSPYGEYWREIRKICVVELFSVKRVQSYESIREEEITNMINSISRHSLSSPNSSSVDLTEKLFALTASMIFRIAFGTSFAGSDFNHNKFNELVHAAEATMGSFSAAEIFPYVGWIVDWLSGLNRRREKVFRELDSFFQRVVDEHLNPGRTKPQQEDIIDVLLKIIKEQARFGAALLTEKNIKAVLLNMFLGGVDTSAITMIWAMAELAKNPTLMKKAQEEVRNIVGNKGKVTNSDIEKLHYLKMIIKETFRLHPAGPLLLPRESTSKFKVNGYEIYPKTLIQVNVWGIGRDPKIWSDPEEFIPERFMDNSIDYKGQHFELLPFGSGRRICPGMYMGTTTVELGLANLLYSFDWELPNGMKEEVLNMDESAGLCLSLAKKTPLELVPKKHLFA
ncbi:hypothetical protein TIFTF001_018226 [Ficus carica]|uniref:Cytochrome P450 n=1 Tax=Ficus carica TaxID=3494 RepID=A0AA88ADN5_FICCA|nr:hypothetical protein TIFTF001_018226 [Ficus carica]